LITSVDAFRDVLGWPGVRWGMQGDEVTDILGARLVPLSPATRFANTVASCRGVLTLRGYDFEALPQFATEGGDLCQVLVRALDTDAARGRALRAHVWERCGPPVASARRLRWVAGGTVLDLDEAAGAGPPWLRLRPAPDEVRAAA
jgi:hypothetical protein